MKRHITFFLMTTLMGVVTTLAHDFSATVDGQQIFFHITDTLQHTVELTYKGHISDHEPTEVRGMLTIPATVRHQNQVYAVTAIGAKAFSRADSLTAVVLPSSIRQIGDFAFERCSSLRSVVFPSQKPALGQGTFFQCTALQDISLGSDWTQIDFSMFRWSDSLRAVTIPSKLVRIQGLKTLRHLTTIQVDANNTAYTSIDGVLYDKQKSRLLCVPRAFNGKLMVPEGVSEMMWGCAIDCPSITEVDLPSTLSSLSFREFSRMPALKSITLRGERLLCTATLDGQDTTLFVVAHPDVELRVPKKMLKAYRKALSQPEADFTEIASHKPQGFREAALATSYRIRRDQMISEKKIKTIPTK